MVELTLPLTGIVAAVALLALVLLALRPHTRAWRALGLLACLAGCVYVFALLFLPLSS